MLRLATRTIATALVLAAPLANAQPGAEPTAAVADVDAHASVELDHNLRPPSAVRARSETPSIRRDAPESSLATTRRWGGGVRLTGLSGIGALPGVNYGVELAALIRHDEYFAELAFGWWRPEERYVVTETPEYVELGLDVWTLRGGWASMQLPLRGWLLVEAGEIAGARDTGMPGVMARMVTGEMPQDHRWQAVGAGFGVAWPMADSARLFGMIEFAVPVNRGNLMIDKGQGEYQPEAMAARSSVGFELGWR